MTFQDNDPSGGQLVNEILKRSGDYHPSSTRNQGQKKVAHMTGRFGFSDNKVGEKRSHTYFEEEDDQNIPEYLSGENR